MSQTGNHTASHFANGCFLRAFSFACGGSIRDWRLSTLRVSRSVSVRPRWLPTAFQNRDHALPDPGRGEPGESGALYYFRAGDPL